MRTSTVRFSMLISHFLPLLALILSIHCNHPSNPSQNQLTSLPSELGGCESLEELDAAGNSLRALPSSLGGLQRLKSIHVDNNRITAIPSEIFLNCAALQTLSLHGNPISPDSIQETAGYQAFEDRRRQKYSKGLAGGVVMGPRGMDEGIDRK